MVEVAGVEPASKKPLPRKSTSLVVVESRLRFRRQSDHPKPSLWS